MPGQTNITITGNLTADPEMRYTQAGAAVTGFTVAANERTYNRETNQYEDAGTLYLRVNCWRELAENTAASLRRGDRVTVTGILRQRDWEDREGNKRTTHEIQADEVAASLRWARVSITRQNRAGNSGPNDSPGEAIPG